jgi:hypothetical protein
MIELTQRELEIVAGGGWASFILPVVIGIATGGPIGAAVAFGGIVATAGVKNLEHMHKSNGEIPTIGQMINR